MTYAVAVNEVNAKSGTIIACPTAGSCGILPWVLKAYNELKKTNENNLKIIKEQEKDLNSYEYKFNNLNNDIKEKDWY